ncbi:unnamed protein product [Peniophora sp. CBMAI 1063]|nr:unnamed protein product [Peniophora sp. CBMAI 1063]
MRLADLAWKAVTEDIIRRCWEKTGILPDMSTPPPTSNPLSKLEQSVSDSLDALDECGVLQKNNCVDLEELVNSAAEQIVVEETSEEEICSAVPERHAEGNVIVIDNDEPETPLPSRTDTLAAVATLQQYISGVDGDFAHSMEKVLADFDRQTRLEGLKGLKDTSITQYFKSA